MNARTPSLPESQWEQLRAAYIAGAGLRALAREAGIAQGTILARSAREGWSALKRKGKATAEAAQGRAATSTANAIANEAAGRAERHVERMSRLCESVGGHVESLPPGRLFESISRLDALDRLARRTHGLDASNNKPTVTILFGTPPSEVFNDAGHLPPDAQECDSDLCLNADSEV